MNLEVSKNEENKTVTLHIELTDEEFRELEEGLTLNKTDLEGDDENGLRRKKFCVTCHGKGPNNSVVQWTEKAYSSVLAHIQGAPKCQRDTGDPGNSVRKGNC